MKKIILSQKAYCLVDDDIFEKYGHLKWHMNTGYAKRTELGKALLLHRLILKAKKGECVDHIDRNKLNNQRNNLRLCSKGQNLMNKKPGVNNISGLKGVRWNKYDNRWTVQISIKSRNRYIGNFKDKDEAKKAYNKAARKHFGKFAYLNK